MQRPAEVPGGEQRRQQIQESFPEPAETEFGFAVLAGAVLHDHLADLESLPVGQDRDIPVEFAVHLHGLDHLPAVCLEAAVEIVNPDAGEQGGDGIEEL